MCMNSTSKFVEELEIKGSTLEIGSYDVNGNIRNLCKGKYVGLDMREGPNVDKVCSSHNLPYRDGRFDNVISLDTIEHDNMFWLSFAEMGRVLKPGGLMVVCAPTIGFHLHNYPSDYYRFTIDSMKFLLEKLAGVKVKVCKLNESGKEVLSYGFKNGIKI